MQTPAEIVQRLREGNERFVNHELSGNLLDSRRREALVEGQAPQAVVLSCADSRVVPEMIFDAGLGELFVIRVAGGVANTSAIASIEYAVSALKTPVIVVMGHESCGAVAAALDGSDLGPNLGHLLEQIAPACRAVDEPSVPTVVMKNAEFAAKALVDRSRIIADAVAANGVSIVVAYYELSTGRVVFP